MCETLGLFELKYKTEPVVSDHLGQPTPARQWWSVLFRSIMKSGDGQTDGHHVWI